MLGKLKSVSKRTRKSQFLPLTLKGLIFSGLLFWVGISGGSVAVILFFIVVASFFYFRPAFTSRQFLASFLVLLITGLLIFQKLYVLEKTQLSIQSVLAMSSWSPYFIFELLAALVGGFLFFLLLGVKNFNFTNRPAFHHLLSSFLFFMVFILFFSADKSRWIFWQYLIVFFTLYLLFREILTIRFYSGDRLAHLPGLAKKNLISAVLAFVLTQLSWAVNLLPIGGLNSASLALLIALILNDLTIHHLSGTLNRQIVLRNATIFIVLTLLVFGASGWSL